MSHFTVLVVGDDVETALAPFHEFECTGRDDQYVVEVDSIEEDRETYAEYKTKRIFSPDGVRHDPYDEMFLRDSTPTDDIKNGSLPGGKIRFIPEGWEERNVLVSEFMTFLEFLKYYHGTETASVGFSYAPGDDDDRFKYGWTEVNNAGEPVRQVRRTNLNRKWDWYEVGGRWSNMLRTTDGDSVDFCLIGDIDFDGMRANARKSREATWDKYYPELARTLSIAAPEEVEGIKERAEWFWSFKDGDTQETYVSRNLNFSTYALLIDGVWYEKGEMGWFGMSNDKMTQEQWEEFFTAKLMDLEPTARITVVDCHI